jgi:hypothetical protein
VSEDAPLVDFVRLVEGLEYQTSGYLTLDAVRAAAGHLLDLVEPAVADNLLLVDHRTRLDRNTGEAMPVTVCRLNRHHPLVRGLSL